MAGYTLATNAGVALAPMTGSTQLLGAGIDDTPSALANIGFAFTFSGTSYTQFSVTPDGFLKFGSPAAASQFTNALASATNIPKLAVYWDDLTTGTAAAGGNVSYLLAGTAPAGPRRGGRAPHPARATGRQLWL